MSGIPTAIHLSIFEEPERVKEILLQDVIPGRTSLADQ